MLYCQASTPLIVEADMTAQSVLDRRSVLALGASVLPGAVLAAGPAGAQQPSTGRTSEKIETTYGRKQVGEVTVFYREAGPADAPVILLLQQSGPETAALVRKIVAEGDVTADEWRTIKDQLRRAGAIETTFDRAAGYAARAKQHLLAGFPSSPERDGLIALADYVVSRDR